MLTSLLSLIKHKAVSQPSVDRRRAEWLGRRKLPKPEAFVVVCPLEIREREIEETKEDFYDRTDVKLLFWHKDILDRKLEEIYRT